MKPGEFSEFTKMAAQKYHKPNKLDLAGLATSTATGTVIGAAGTMKALDKRIPDYSMGPAVKMLSGKSKARFARVRPSALKIGGKMGIAGIGGILGGLLASRAYLMASKMVRKKQ
jgi:hypothetical protein